MPWRELEPGGPWRRWPLIVLFASLAVTIAGVTVDELVALIGSVLASSTPAQATDVVHETIQRRRPRGHSDDSALMVLHVVGDTPTTDDGAERVVRGTHEHESSLSAR